MKLEAFFERFDQLAPGPNAVVKMRELILRLAMQGKLVPQDPHDKPADALLLEIMAEVLDKNGRRNHQLPPITALEIPFELPAGWVWERLGNIGETNIGLTYSPQDVSDGGTPVLRSSNIQNGKLDFEDLVRVKFEPKQSVMVRDGDLLICARNGSRALVGKVAIIEDLKEPTAFGAFMAIFRSRLNMYLYHFICSPLFRRMIDEVNTTTINQITQANLRSTLAPIPPLAEQNRIVAKVDELMALCDRLAAEHQDREARHEALSRASLARFGDAPTPANLQFLFHKSYDVRAADLRKAILTLAIQGKLVPQNPYDESGEMLLTKIRCERLTAIKARQIGPMKSFLPVTDEEFAYDLRPGWAVARLTELVMEMQTGPFGSSLHQSDYELGGTPVINPASLKNGKIVPIDSMAIGSVTLKRLEVFRLREGDIVMARRGEMGRCAIVTKNEDGWLCGTGSLVLRMPKSLHAPYLALLIGSPEVREYLGGASVGTTMQNLNQTILGKMPVGIPPLAEQRRIMAKVDQLMALVDELESQLDASRTKGEKLMEAVVAELTAQGSKPVPDDRSHRAPLVSSVS